ncbi:MAG TPA: 16S rRNA (guanine(527)-N(7))-methyltransferase RsmG [Candidatus Eisenbacteria bacterium]|nr:16S rRNA (guanine(527)-N(7))-methyltransferase RsmG [Candidatus Eisenbacteria bacterium]
MTQPKGGAPGESALLANLAAETPGVADAAALTLSLSEFLAEIRGWNARGNLVSQSDLSRLVSRHVAESLAIVPLIDRLGVRQILDVGSGGGFPIVPVKLARSELAVALVESRRMKSLFLRRVGSRLDLRNFWVWTTRVEPLAQLPATPESSSLERVAATVTEEMPALRPVVDLVMARAVASLADLARWSEGLVRPGGWLLTFKGSKLEEEIAEWKRSPGPWDLESVEPGGPGVQHVVLRRT